MTEAEKERAAIVAYILEYGEVNMEICGDGILLDPLLRGGPWTEENVELSDDCSSKSLIHSSKYHACRELAQAIESGAHLTQPMEAQGGG